jgi:hypothetical protein
MPKNTKGGNKAKKQKNNNQPTKNREIPVPEDSDDSHIAVISKVQGDTRYLCNIVGMNGVDQKAILVNLSTGIKNKYGRGIIVTTGTHILISLRSFQKDKGDIIFIYRDSELSYLVENNFMIITKSNNDEGDIIFANFVDAPSNTISNTSISLSNSVSNNATENSLNNADVFDLSAI